MSKKLEELLHQIMQKLQWLQPDLWVLPAHSPDMTNGIRFLPIKELCYITTDSDLKNFKLLYQMQNGAKFYSNDSLLNLEKKLWKNPQMMRSQKSYIINLTQIRGMDYSQARDLWFEGKEDPIKNAVSTLYLDEFKARFEDIHKS